MLIQPIDYFLVVWFALAAASTAYVAWDQYRNNPEPAVMKWGFMLVTLYMGPSLSESFSILSGPTSANGTRRYSAWPPGNPPSICE